MLRRICAPLVALYAVLIALCPACSTPADPALGAKQSILRLEASDTMVAIELGLYGSIFWLLPEEAATTGEVRIVIDDALSVSSACSTTYGFEPPNMGQRRSTPIAPGSGVVICFHEAGEYAFRVEGLNGSLAGVIKVEGRR